MGGSQRQHPPSSVRSLFHTFIIIIIIIIVIQFFSALQEIPSSSKEETTADEDDSSFFYSSSTNMALQVLTIQSNPIILSNKIEKLCTNNVKRLYTIIQSQIVMWVKDFALLFQSHIVI